MTEQLVRIPIEQITPHPHNPRGVVDPDSLHELADSIREKGILEPLLVVEVRDPSATWKIKHYLLVAGHRRWNAGKIAGLQNVPAIIRDLSPIEQEEIMLIENLQREDLSLFQQAKAFQRLIDQKLRQQDIARKLGIAQATVGHVLQIMKLSKPVQRLYEKQELPLTAAPLLVKIESSDRQQTLAGMVASRKLPIGKLEEMVHKEVAGAGAKKATIVAKRLATRQTSAPVEIYTRLDAEQELAAQPDISLTRGDLLQAFQGQCDRCGMKNHPEICNACPLPQFIKAVVRGHAAEVSL